MFSSKPMARPVGGVLNCSIGRRRTIGKLQRITQPIFQVEAGAIWSNHVGLVLCAAVGHSSVSIGVSQTCSDSAGAYPDLKQ
jgi:hypothetical protein